MSNRPGLRDHRLRIMEGVLVWEGEIGNARVRELFDLQVVQASRLLGDFRRKMAGQIVEDTRSKTLKPTSHNRLEPGVSLVDYAQLTHLHEASNPRVIDARCDLTAVSPEIFSVIRKAATKGLGVSIQYASMAHPVFESRTVYPHSIVLVGRRWHVRAWCEKRQQFRDFNLGRISTADALPTLAPMPQSADLDWQKMIEVRLSAHRALSPEQQTVVQRECLNGARETNIVVRSCLAAYVIQDIRAAMSVADERPPQFQLEVLNAADIRSLLFSGG